VSYAEQLLLVLTWGRRRYSPNVNRNKQDKAFVCFSPSFISEADGILQATSSKRMFKIGSLPLTRRQTTTSFWKHDMVKLEHGYSRVKS
jgi:hypothetical protein